MTSSSESQQVAVAVRLGSLSTKSKFLLVAYPVEKALTSLKSLADGHQRVTRMKAIPIPPGEPQRENFWL